MEHKGCVYGLFFQTDTGERHRDLARFVADIEQQAWGCAAVVYADLHGERMVNPRNVEVLPEGATRITDHKQRTFDFVRMLTDAEAHRLHGDLSYAERQTLATEFAAATT